MNLLEARLILENLADGIDPATGSAIEPGSPLDQPEVTRALNMAMALMDAQIESGKGAGLLACPVPRSAFALPGEEAQAALRPAAPRGGKSWTAEEDRELGAAFDSRRPLADIAATFGRTEDAIAARLVRIGRVPDRQSARNALRRRPPATE